MSYLWVFIFNIHEKIPIGRSRVQKAGVHPANSRLRVFTATPINTYVNMMVTYAIRTQLKVMETRCPAYHYHM